MTNTKLLLVTIVLATAAGCSKKSSSSSSAKAAPCDPDAVKALAANLELANGMGIDLTEKGSDAKIASAKAAVMGKEIAFSGCTFDSQGNDIVAFGPSTGGHGVSIECAMKGGEAGVTEFRHAAMELDMKKLRLDVHGKVAASGDRVAVTGCEITAHE
jgi:hypothetical protein